MPISRPKHPKSMIEKAVKCAEQLGWRVEISKKGHAWGKVALPVQFERRM